MPGVLNLESSSDHPGFWHQTAAETDLTRLAYHWDDVRDITARILRMCRATTANRL